MSDHTVYDISNRVNYKIGEEITDLTENNLLTVTFDKESSLVSSLKDAREVYRTFIEVNNLGASASPFCGVSFEGKIFAFISYNGRVWSITKEVK